MLKCYLFDIPLFLLIVYSLCCYFCAICAIFTSHIISVVTSELFLLVYLMVYVIHCYFIAICTNYTIGLHFIVIFAISARYII